VKDTWLKLWEADESKNWLLDYHYFGIEYNTGIETRNIYRCRFCKKPVASVTSRVDEETKLVFNSCGNEICSTRRILGGGVVGPTLDEQRF